MGIQQKLYNCVTCNMKDGYCICENCIKNCHKGHNVVFSEEDIEGYCDCGEQSSRGITSCNMLKGRICCFYSNCALFLQTSFPIFPPISGTFRAPNLMDS